MFEVIDVQYRSPREAGGRRDARSDTGRSRRYLRAGTLCGSPAVPECPAAPIAARSPRISSYNSRSFQLPVRVPSACRRPQPSDCPPQFQNPMFIASSRRTVRLTLTCIFSSPTISEPKLRLDHDSVFMSNLCRHITAFLKLTARDNLGAFKSTHRNSPDWLQMTIVTLLRKLPGLTADWHRTWQRVLVLYFWDLHIHSRTINGCVKPQGVGVSMTPFTHEPQPRPL